MTDLFYFYILDLEFEREVLFLFFLFGEGEMNRIEDLEYCTSVYDSGIFEAVKIVIDWYIFSVKYKYSKIILVITKAAGKGTGFHIDIYIFEQRISRKCLKEKIQEGNRKEEIRIVNNLIDIVLFLICFTRRLKGLP